MGLFGGGNSASTSQTTTNNVGFQDVQGPAGSIVGNNNTLQLTDLGAIKESLNFAGNSFKDSVDMSKYAIKSSADLNQNSMIFAADRAHEAQGFVERSNANAINKFSEFANRTTASNDDRLITVTKYAVGAVVLSVMAPMLLRAFSK